MSETLPQRVNFFDLDRAGLEAYFVSIGEKPFRARQVLKWVYHERVLDFERMSDLSRPLRERLASLAEFRLPSFAPAQVSIDGTTKWLVQLDHGGSVETVYIPETDRGTLCISSQVGCSLNCAFCATGRQGFNRNLTTAEVIGQLWLAAGELGHDRERNRRITNVVMMGMGEPLLNFEPVVRAVQLMRDDLGFGLGIKRVTLSTAGLVPAMDRLAEVADVSLAVSLHAPTDELRSQLVPLNKKYPIAELMAACQRFQKRRPRSVITFEYTLLDGVNDQLEHARGVVKLLRRVPSKLNLIPFNPFPGAPFHRPQAEAVAAFQKLIHESGEFSSVRKTRGEDIDAACGQLAGDVHDRTRRSSWFRPASGEVVI